MPSKSTGKVFSSPNVISSDNTPHGATCTVSRAPNFQSLRDSVIIVSNHFMSYRNGQPMTTDAYDVMDLKALRCFWATARRGSLTQAGIDLGISEAAVSQRLKALERHLGVKLYESRGGRIYFTLGGR